MNRLSGMLLLIICTLLGGAAGWKLPFWNFIVVLCAIFAANISGYLEGFVKGKQQ